MMKALFAITTAILLGFIVFLYTSPKTAGFQEQVYKYMLKKCGPTGSLMVLFALDGSELAAGGCHEGEGIFEFTKDTSGKLLVGKRGAK
jgi:hypothetical protein